ncbi:MAG: apolipoprotein N-acyltransferase [Permianibacter sp.]
MQAFFTRWGMTLLALAAGAMFPLAFSPIDLPWFSALSLALLLLGWRQATPKQAAWRGLCWGVGAFAVGVSWVHVAIRDFGQAPLALSLFLTAGMVVALALFVAAVGWLLARLFTAPSARLMAFAPLWVVGEFLRGHLFTGFPWLFAGYAHTDTVLRQLLPWFGVYGVSLAVALAATLLLWAAQRSAPAPSAMQRKRTVLLKAVVVVALIGLFAPQRAPSASAAQMVKGDGNQLSIALVQANIEQNLKWRHDQLNRILRQYQELTLPLLGKVDAVVWPEAAIPAFADNLGDYFPRLDQAARDSGTALITGLPVANADGSYYNAIVGLGTASGRYDKRHLVPFGEYVPFQSVLRGMFAFFNLPMSGFSEGERAARLQVGAQSMVGAVCYEIAYPELVRDNVRALNGGPGYLLTVSNDAWFGESFGPWQHLQIARTRALENGLPVIRATVTGVSAVIGPDGRITDRLPQFETAILRTTVSAAKPDTVWVNWGLVPVSILVALLLGIAGWRQRLNSRSKAPELQP